MPRQRTMLPGGASLLRPRKPPSFASRIRKSPTDLLSLSSFIGSRCSSSFISVSVNTKLAGSSGDTRLSWHIHNTRHARMHMIAIKLASRSAFRSFESSARQPDFSTLWKVSIFHLNVYHSSFSTASALLFTLRSVISFQEIGARSFGVPRSTAWITVRVRLP